MSSASASRFQTGYAVQGGGVDHREVELLVGRAQFVKQFKHLIHYPVWASARAVHFVDSRQSASGRVQRLSWSRSGSVASGRRSHQPAAARNPPSTVHALHFAAEIGVPRGVHDIDAVAVPIHASVLGEDGDAALFLLVVAVHHALGLLAAAIQRARLFQQLVHQRGFAMVNVGNDGDVAQLFDRVCGGHAGTGGVGKRGRIIRGEAATM
jgi:hypothetical protein